MSSEKAAYICGPMSGMPKLNFPAFEDAAKQLRLKGWRVISPVEVDQELDMEFYQKIMASSDTEAVACPPTIDTWGDTLSRDVRLVIDKCDSIMLLPGWEKSRGAKIEAFIGTLFGHKFYLYIPTLFNVAEISKYDVQEKLFSKLAR